MPPAGRGPVIRGAAVAEDAEAIREFRLGEAAGRAQLEAPCVLIGGAGDCEAGVAVGPEFGTEGGDGEVVEGVEAGGGRHCRGGRAGWRWMRFATRGVFGKSGFCELSCCFVAGRLFSTRCFNTIS